MQNAVVGELVVPTLLLRLLMSKSWKLPSDKIVHKAIPFLAGPIDLLPDINSICQSSPAAHTPNYGTSERDLLELLLAEEREYDQWRISYRREERCKLAWLDGNLAVCLAVNRAHGDDTMIALDYRDRMDCPRVVANEWTKSACAWHVVFDSLEDMAVAFGMLQS